MNKFFDFDSIQVRGSRSGVKKTICPVCSADRKKKNDPCLYVNFDSGVAKCFNCTSLSFAESNALKTNKKEYSIILQEWKNYTELSDDLVKWVWSDRKISQNTLNQLEISEEKHYQPSKQKELNNIVFNYFEGEQLVNKKFRSGGKDLTQFICG